MTTADVRPGPATRHLRDCCLRGGTESKQSLSVGLLFLTLALAAALRLYRLDTVPPGLFCDEASVGLDAHSLLTTGRDSHGAFMPLFFESFGDYRGGIAVYSAVPFVAVLGMTELAVRLPSVVYGLLLVWVLYLFGRDLGNRECGLLVAFVAATMPWLIHYNRTGFIDFNAYAFFFALTAYLFYRRRLTWAFVCAGVCLYAYQPAKLLIPLLVVCALVIYRKSLRFSWKGPALFAALCIPVAVSMLNGTGLRRFGQVSVLSAHLSPAQTALRIASNYAVQLSPHYFLEGEGTPITRHFTDGLLPVLPVTLPFLVIGILVVVFTCRESRTSRFLLAWLLLYPVAGAATLEPPFTSRSIIGAPLFAILIAAGISRTAKFLMRLRLTRDVVVGVAALAICVSLASFMRFYLVQYPLQSAGFYGWQYGARDIVRYFVSVEGQYDDLLVGDERHAFNGAQVFIPFYAPGDCAKCRLGQPDDSFNPERRQLFAVTPEYLEQHREYAMTVKKTIYYPNGSVAFQTGTVHALAVDGGAQ